MSNKVHNKGYEESNTKFGNSVKLNSDKTVKVATTVNKDEPTDNQ